MRLPICGTISLVLKMSRLFGMAPLTFGPDGIRFSQVYYIYSIVFITVFKTAILSMFSLGVSRPELFVDTSTSTPYVISVANLLVSTAVTAVGCLTAPRRCRTMLDTLTRIEKIRKLMEDTENEYDDVKCIYTMFYYITALLIVVFSDTYQTLSDSYGLMKEVLTTIMLLITDAEFLIELLLEFQFMLVVFQLTMVLRAVNNRLKLIQRKESEEQSNEEVRVLWLVNEQVCDLVRNVDEGFGLLLLLLMQSLFLHFIMTPYYIIGLYQMPFAVTAICNEVAWFHFHAARVMLIVDPCHLLQKQMLQTRSLVCKLLCEARPYGRLSRSLAAFSKSLTLDQPRIAPKGMFVLKRPLLITILGVISTYLVPRTYNSIPNSTNATNDTDVYMFEMDYYY